MGSPMCSRNTWITDAVVMMVPDSTDGREQAAGTSGEPLTGSRAPVRRLDFREIDYRDLSFSY